MGQRIVLLPGDGIGPEIIGAARRLLDALADFEITELLVGGASIDAHGTALTGEVLEACLAADAVLLGAVGGPKWDTTDPDTCEYSAEEIDRIARVAFDSARQRAEGSSSEAHVTSVDKANVLETSRLWRETVSRVGEEYSDVALDHLLVDNAAMQLVSR